MKPSTSKLINFRVAATVAGFAAIAGVLTVGCGGGTSKSSSTTTAAATLSEAEAPQMDTCVNRWRKDLPNDNISVAAKPGMRAMVFTYKGHECGVVLDMSQTDPAHAAVGAMIYRGPKAPHGNFAAMIVPTNDGGGVPQINADSEALLQMVKSQSNATVNGDLTLTPDSGAEIVRTEAHGAPNGNYVTQPETMIPRYNYSTNLADWKKLTQKEQIAAIAQFYTDNKDVCQKKALEGTAKAYRDGKLYPTRDGMQVTLWISCVYFGIGVDPTKYL